MPEAILDIDIGNTFTKWRFDEGPIHRAQSERQILSSSTLGSAIKNADLVRLSAVGPSEVQSVISAACQTEGVSIWEANTHHPSQLSHFYPNPEQLGVDRWLGLLAIRGRLEADNILLVSCGSALVIDLLSGHRHLGGFIAPGLKVMVDAINQNLVLPELSIDGHATLKPGGSSLDCMKSGVLLNMVGAIERASKFFPKTDYACAITGGDAELVAPLLSHSSVKVDNLVLDGLAIQYNEWADRQKGSLQ